VIVIGGDLTPDLYATPMPGVHKRHDQPAWKRLGWLVSLMTLEEMKRYDT
jgi:hypothetical protein